MQPDTVPWPCARSQPRRLPTGCCSAARSRLLPRPGSCKGLRHPPPRAASAWTRVRLWVSGEERGGRVACRECSSSGSVRQAVSHCAGGPSAPRGGARRPLLPCPRRPRPPGVGAPGVGGSHRTGRCLVGCAMNAPFPADSALSAFSFAYPLTAHLLGRGVCLDLFPFFNCFVVVCFLLRLKSFF